MADKTRYPQIPSTVWWGVRSILQRTPNATVDERLLGVQLEVQEAAARQYIAELKAANVITDEGKATPLAQKWRLDDTYTDAVKDLVASIYPEGLRHIAPLGDADRSKIVNWFMLEGLGKGAAGNKAATYLLVSSPTPNESPTRGATQASKEGGDARTRRQRATSKTRAVSSAQLPAERTTVMGGSKGVHSDRHPPASEKFPLYVNVQIHISADAGSEQIESIFSAMRKYLHDAPGT
jgi:hypothetical protein